jgi:diaminopimelate decarboxylase
MDYFNYKNGQLYAEDVPVAEIATAVGTPVYIYSHKTLERHFLVFDRAFKKIPHIVCYSCKANSNIALLRLMARLGGGADIVSGGELYRSLGSSIPPEKIVFSGVGKTEAEIRYAARAGIAMFNIESEDELRAVAGIGRKLRKRIPVSIRVNPEIDPKTHPYITTGLKKNKFGILWGDAVRLYGEIAGEPWLLAVGISSHIGSQITEMEPFIQAVRSLKGMAEELSRAGTRLTFIDIGGGLGITYNKELPPLPKAYAAAIEPELAGTGLTLILEPGRVIVGNSGIFVSRLLYVKKTAAKTFYVVDGAMNDLVRPALYGAYHEIIPAQEKTGEKRKVDVVGPICESGDFFARDRALPLLKGGDLIAVLSAGAYGFSMASNYNSRRRAAEVLVKGDKFFIIRKRETPRDLTRGETIPDFLKE